jgi:hypothetical protein
MCLWLFLFPIFVFAVPSKEFFLDGLKKLEQRCHKCVCVCSSGGICRVNTFFNPVACCFIHKVKELSALLVSINEVLELKKNFCD